MALTDEERRRIREFARDPEAIRESARAYFDGRLGPSRMTPELRKRVKEFARDPEAIRESARAYFEGLTRALQRHGA